MIGRAVRAFASGGIAGGKRMTVLGITPTLVDARPQARRSEAVLVSACLVAFGAFLFFPNVLADGDTLWHVAAGEWMLQHLRVPHADPFSVPHLGQRWIAHEWLAEVL